MEYGADMTIVNNRQKTVSESCANKEFQHTLKSILNYYNWLEKKLFLIDVSRFIASVVPSLTNGDKEVLDRVISDHVEERYTLR